MKDSLTSVPPHHLEAEQAVLGGVILSPACFDLASYLSPEDFYLPRHQWAWEAILDLRKQDKPLDVLGVLEHLRHYKHEEESGGLDYLAGLADALPCTANLGYYVRLVREKSNLRRAAALGRQLASDAMEAEEANALLVEVEQQARTLQEGSGQEPTTLKAATARTFERLARIYDGQEQTTGLPLGFTALDSMLGGFQPTDLIILAARPGMGKTDMALNIAANVARDLSSGCVVIFSLEMGEEQLVIRLLARQARVDSIALRLGKLKSDDLPEVVNATQELSQWPIYLEDRADRTPSQIRAICQTLAQKHGPLALVIVDYLQLMHGDKAKGYERRETEIAEISRSLKILAKDMKVPVVALSQLNRKADVSGETRPALSHLRESGAIEQDADVVMMLYRDPEGKSLEMGVTEVIIAKHRHGPTGTAKLAYNPVFGRFDNLAQGYA